MFYLYQVCFYTVAFASYCFWKNSAQGAVNVNIDYPFKLEYLYPRKQSICCPDGFNTMLSAFEHFA